MASCSRLDNRTSRMRVESMTARRILESVIDDDERTLVLDTKVFPWSSVCALRITTRYGYQYVGSGCLVSPRLVLTAGHCVFDRQQGGWPRFIEVIPGCNGGIRPVGSCFSSEFRAVFGWLESEDVSYDYGAILLPADCRLGDYAGYLGIAEVSPASLLRAELTLPGYPLDKPRCTQWRQTKRPIGVVDRILTYDIDTESGQSGSPLLYSSGGASYVTAIHTSGGSRRNSALRIDGGVFANIVSWIDEGP